jgi:hypothetical protein
MTGERPTDRLDPEDPFAVRLPPLPYPGLRPFERGEWPIFFGRETMTAEVIDRLLAGRMLVVHGDSGCGKSSLIRAGVQAQLEQEQARSGHRWITVEMRPGESPLGAMAQALDRGRGPGSALDLRRVLNRGRDAAAALDGPLGLAGDERLCLLVDQLEELFRFAKEGGGEEAELFAAVLVGLGSAPPRGLYPVIAMRSEFLGQCARYEGLAETLNRVQYLLPPVDRPGLARAIREPARLYGGEIEPALAEALIADAGGGQDRLPLIQHGLMRLWVGAGPGNGPRLGLADYRSAAGLEAMLSAHADGVMDGVAPPGDVPRRSWVEHLFRALTDLNADGHAVRRPQTFAELLAVTGAERGALLKILDAFRAEGVSFLTPYGDAPIGDETRIDVGHEALIRCWRRLADPDPRRGWLQRELKDGLTWQTLQVLAAAFDDDPSKVLAPAATLDLSAWLGTLPSQAWSERYGGGHREVRRLLAASEEALGRQRAEAEQARRREARQALLRRFLAVAAVLAGLAVAAALLAWRNAGEAAREREEAVAARLDAELRFREAVAQTEALGRQKAETDRLIAELRLKTQSAATATSPDGRLMASVDGDDRLYLLDIVSGQPVPVPGPCAQVRPDAVAFSPDGRTLAVASGGQAWVLGLPDTCRRLGGDPPATGPLAGADPGRIRRLAFSPDGRLLATGGGGGAGRPDGTADPGPATAAAPGTEPGPGLSGGPSAAPAADRGFCRVWDTATGGLVESLVTQVTLVDVAFDDTGRRLIAKGADGSVLEWRLSEKGVRDASWAATPVQGPVGAGAPAQASVYLHIAAEGDRLAATAWQGLLGQAGVAVPGIELVGGRAPADSELRFFRKADADEAGRIADRLRRAGLRVRPTYVAGYEASTRVRPRQLELWLAAEAIGYWFPVVASIHDRQGAVDQARTLRAKLPDDIPVQVYEAFDAKGQTVYAVTLGGYLSERDARARVAYARTSIAPSAYPWETRAWGMSLWGE